MAERKNTAPALDEGLTSESGGPRTSQLLERLDAAVPWEKLTRPVLRLPEYRARGEGRPVWPPIAMLKCLLLAKWFNLSDRQMHHAAQLLLFRCLISQWQSRHRRGNHFAPWMALVVTAGVLGSMLSGCEEVALSADEESQQPEPHELVRIDLAGTNISELPDRILYCRRRSARAGAGPC